MDQEAKDNLLQMIADHNAECQKNKVFYYSEEEVKELCRLATMLNFQSGRFTFEDWWNNVKKK
jgi:hypothetical protein